MTNKKKNIAIYSSSIVLRRRWRDNADPVPNLCNSSYESSGKSAGGTAIYKFHVPNKINKCICIKYVSSHVINYQHVSITYAVILGVPLQEYEEYNNLPHWMSRTTQCYNKCLKEWVVVEYFIHLGKKEIDCIFRTCCIIPLTIPQNAVYFIISSFSVQIIVTFIINHAIKFKYQQSFKS